MYNYDIKIKEAYLERITSQEDLKFIALNEEDADIRLKAVKKLS